MLDDPSRPKQTGRAPRPEASCARSMHPCPWPGALPYSIRQQRLAWLSSMAGRAPSVLLTVLCLSALLAAGGVLFIVHSGPGSPQPARPAGCGRVCVQATGAWLLAASLGCERRGAWLARQAAGLARGSGGGPRASTKRPVEGRPGGGAGNRQVAQGACGRAACVAAGTCTASSVPAARSAPLSCGAICACSRTAGNCAAPCACCTILQSSPPGPVPEQRPFAQQHQPAGNAALVGDARAPLDDAMHGAVASMLPQTGGCMGRAALAVAHALLRVTFAAATPPSPPPPPPTLWR
jgi:hypothetical protein